MRKLGRLNKKGDLAISTIILLVLGLMVMIGAIYLLATQKGFFKDTVGSFSDENNVDDVVLSCNSLVGNEQVYTYCCEEKKVNMGSEKIEKTCSDLVDEGFVGGRIGELDCSAISC